MNNQEWNHIDQLDPDTPDLGSWIGTPAEEAPNAEDAEDSPRERPLAVEDYGVTDWEQAHPEPITARLGRERPDHRTRRPESPEGADGAAAGRLVLASDGQVTIATGDTGGVSSEEIAVHLDFAHSQAEPTTMTERLDTVEHEITALVEASRLLADALEVLAKALQPAPAEEPGDARHRIGQAGRDVRELLLSARNAC